MFLRYNAYMEAGITALAPDRGYDFVFPDGDFIWRSAHLFAPTDEEELACYYDYRRMGPAYEKLYELTEAWRSEPKLLLMKDKGEEIKILDTRLIARQPLYHLTGAAAELIRAARDATKKSTLVEKLVDIFAEKEIKEAIEFLVRDNLLLQIGEEYLALPVDRDANRNGA